MQVFLVLQIYCQTEQLKKSATKTVKFINEYSIE